MHAILSFLAQATPVAFAMTLVAAVFAALRPARVEPAAAVVAPVTKPAPAEPLAKTSSETPAVVHGGDAKGRNFDLFGGWPDGYVPPTPAEVKAQVARVIRFRVSAQMHEQLEATAQARGQKL